MSYSTETAFDRWVDFDMLWHAAAQSFGDEDFYAKAASTYGRPSVELGVGYGRIAELTVPDVGIDLSSRSLQQCRERLDRSVRLIQEDFRSYAVDEPAAFSYAPLGTLNHIISSTERVEALRNIRVNTRPGGMLLFDSYITSEARMREMNQIVVNIARSERIALYKAERIIDFDRWISENFGYAEYLDSDGSVVQRTHFKGPQRVYVPPHMFAIELGRAGWTVKDVWGGFDGRPLTESSPRQVWLATNLTPDEI